MKKNFKNYLTKGILSNQLMLDYTGAKIIYEQDEKSEYALFMNSDEVNYILINIFNDTVLLSDSRESYDNINNLLRNNSWYTNTVKDSKELLEDIIENTGINNVVIFNPNKPMNTITYRSCK